MDSHPKRPDGNNECLQENSHDSDDVILLGEVENESGDNDSAADVRDTLLWNDETNGNNRRSAFNRVYRISLTEDDNPDFSSPLFDNTPQRNSRRVRPLPGVYRVPSNGISESNSSGGNNELQSLPHAYPVPNNQDQPELFIDLSSHSQSRSREEEEEEDYADSVNQDYHDNQIAQKYTMALYLLIIVTVVAGVGIPLSYYNVEPTSFYDADEIRNNSSHPTLPPNTNGTHGTNLSLSSYEEKKEKENNETAFECFRDPLIIQILEWEAFERGDDPSIPRTYNFCANSTMRVYSTNHKLFTFDPSSGDVFPLMIFRPNVNILCGEDGSFENRCTFNGGKAQIVLTESPLFVSYNLNTTTENVTIEGFRFTGTRNGLNIVNRSNVTNITVKNCRFDNNYDMIASLFISPPYVKASTAHVHNCTFDSNTYTHYSRFRNISIEEILWRTSTSISISEDVWRAIPNIGVILSLPFASSNAVVNIYVSDTTFSNNSFLINSDSISSMNSISSNVTATGSIINLLPPVESISVTNTYFKENTDFSSGLIILGEYEHSNRTSILQEYSGNEYVENTSNNNNNNRFYGETSASPCVLVYQNLIFVDGYPVSSTLEEREGCVVT